MAKHSLVRKPTVANLNLINFFSDVQRGISNFVWGIVIALIVIFAVIVVIFLVVILDDKQKTLSVQQPGPSGPPMVPVGGKCPMCGSTVDP
jgi:preprotein translocase subunit SecY